MLAFLYVAGKKKKTRKQFFVYSLHHLFRIKHASDTKRYGNRQQLYYYASFPRLKTTKNISTNLPTHLFITIWL